MKKNFALYFALFCSLVFSLSVIASMPFAAKAAQHAIGTNIISPDGSVSVITTQGGQIVRRSYTSSAAFLSYGFNNWNNVIVANPEDLALPIGSFVPPQDGKIICSDRGSDQGTCYLISKGTKAGFVSAQVFFDLGYKFDNRVTFGDISFLPLGSNISDANTRHISGTLINKDGTIYLASDLGLLGIPSLAVFNSWGYFFEDAVLANAADRSLSVVGNLEARQPGQLSPSDSGQIGTQSNLYMSLDASSPASSNIAAGSSMVAVLSAKLTAGNNDIKISSLGFDTARYGQLCQFADFKLFDGATQIGSTVNQPIISEISCGVQFENLYIVIPKNTSKVLTLKLSVIPSATPGTFSFSLGAIGHIIETSGSSVNVSGVATGNVMTIVNSLTTIRTGQLINKNGTVYLVGNGGLYGIPDLATFNSWNLAFGSVLPANSAEITLPQIGIVPAKLSCYSDILTQINSGVTSCPSSVTVGFTRAQAARKLIEKFPANAPVPLYATFADVPTANPNYTYIEQFYSRGITSGCEYNSTTGIRKFCPTNPTQRWQAMVFLGKILGSKINLSEAPQTQVFKDVPSTHAAYSYVQYFYQKGVTLGCRVNTDGSRDFCPDDNLTEEQLNLLIDRVYTNIGYVAPTPLPGVAPSLTTVLDPSTSVSKNIVSGASNIDVVTVKLTANADTVRLESFEVISDVQACPVSSFTLYDGPILLGSIVPNGYYCQVGFTNLNLIIPQNTSKALTLKISVPASVYSSARFAVRPTRALALSTGAIFPISGNWIYGNLMSIAQPYPSPTPTPNPTPTTAPTPTPTPTPTSTIQPLSITTNTLPNATAGQSYSTSIQISGGVAPYAWTMVSTTYPSGCCILGLNGNGDPTYGTTMAFNTQSGQTVVTSYVGTYTWNIKVTDAAGNSTTKILSLTINPAITPTPTPTPTPTSAVTLTPYAFTAAPGTLISVAWTAPAGSSAKDWVALYKVGDPNTAYGSWKYTNGEVQGTFATWAPSTTGSYEFRYLINDGYTSVAKSATITVSP